MRKPLASLVCLMAALVLAPRALGQSFSASLNGSNEVGAAGDPDGSGVAVVTFSGTTVGFSILANKIAAPTAAHIHRGATGSNGPVVVDFKPTFNGLGATGSVTAEKAIIDEIVGNPAGFYVNVHNSEFTAGAIRGQLTSPVVTEVFYPTVVKAPGLNNTFFVSDLAAINTSAQAAVMTVEAFLSNPDGLTSPSAVKTALVPAGGQLAVSDVLGTLFGIQGVGAARIVSDQPLLFSHRVLNDRRAQNEGASMLNVRTVTRSEALMEGYLPQLSQASPADQSAGIGFRTNVGWFNPGMASVKATFRLRKPDGTVAGSVDRDIKAYSQFQVSIFELFPALVPADLAQSNFFISFSATGGPLFVYATVVDNKTGDGLYQAAQPKP